ncbi:MAG: TatD family hydrolase [Oceanospirillaceae bacterium]
MIDIGANLTNSRFQNDLEEILEASKEASIDKIIVTGTDIPSSKAAIELSSKYQGLYATAGIHPHAAASFDQSSFEQLGLLLKHPKVVAVGECGLDFNRNFSTKEQQIHAFEQQLILATSSEKPLFLHEREAFSTQYSMLKEHVNDICGAVVHCFTGNQDALVKYLELGFYIGITGWVCDERRGLELQSIINLIPDNKLLIETDAPYLTPRTLKGKQRKAKNTPANLIHIAAFIAQLRNQSTQHIVKMTSANAQHLFSFDHK